MWSSRMTVPGSQAFLPVQPRRKTFSPFFWPACYLCAPPRGVSFLWAAMVISISDDERVVISFSSYDISLSFVSLLLSCLCTRLWRQNGWFIWWQNMLVEGKYLVSTLTAFCKSCWACGGDPEKTAQCLCHLSSYHSVLSFSISKVILIVFDALIEALSPSLFP